MTTTSATEDPQLGLEEEVRDDPDLLALLEERTETRARFLRAKKAYDDSSEKVRAGAADLPVGKTWRVAQYKLTRKYHESKEIEAHTREGKERLNISVVKAAKVVTE